MTLREKDEYHSSVALLRLYKNARVFFFLFFTSLSCCFSWCSLKFSHRTIIRDSVCHFRLQPWSSESCKCTSQVVLRSSTFRGQHFGRRVKFLMVESLELLSSSWSAGFDSELLPAPHRLLHQLSVNGSPVCVSID